MRVLALTNLYPNPYQPNRATFNRQQLAALAKSHDVRVIAPISWTDEWSARRRSTGGTSLMPANRQRIADGMVIDHPRYLFTPKVLRGSYGRCVVASVRRSFQAAVREFRPDVVLGCWAYPDGWAAVRLAREAGLPVVVKVHGSDLLSAGQHPARMTRTRETMAAADAVIAVSVHLGEQAIAMGAARKRVHVVYNGVDASIFHPGPKATARRTIGLTSDEPLLLFVGNLVGVKGINVLIDALASVRAAGSAFQCALVGEGPLKAELQAQIDARGLTDRVRLIGARPLTELPLWYQAADLVVLPSHSEGVPNVLLEATACGTPFIATRVGGIPEIAASNSLLPPADPVALAERINAFLTTPERVPSPHAASTWEDSARALASVMQGVVSVPDVRHDQAA